MHGTDTKNLLLIHIILVANDFAKTKIRTFPSVGGLVTWVNRLMNKQKWFDL